MYHPELLSFLLYDSYQEITYSSTINDISKNEGNSGTSGFNFTVTIDPVCSLPVYVNYSTPSEGTATNTTDYLFATGTVEIAADQKTGTISIQVVRDTTFEPDEIFVVFLGSATNAKIADDRGIGTIKNDDIQIPDKSINDVTLEEGNSGRSNMVFTVTLSLASSNDVTVNYATVNGTATAGSDYTSTSGLLTIPASQTSDTITIPIIGDTIYEPNETFYSESFKPNPYHTH